MDECRSLTTKAARMYDGTSRPWQQLLARYVCDKMKSWLLTIVVSFQLCLHKSDDVQLMLLSRCVSGGIQPKLLRTQLITLLLRQCASGVGPASGASRKIDYSAKKEAFRCTARLGILILQSKHVHYREPTNPSAVVGPFLSRP